MPVRITTYKQAFEGVLKIGYDEQMQTLTKRMECAGHTEHSICFAIWKTQDKLLKHKQDVEFFSILENEIKQWSWTKDDPRWDRYYEKKAEADKARRSKNIGYIYFVQGKSGGAIKIGYTEYPESQIQVLQTGYPDVLTVLLLMEGTRKDKDTMLEKFSALRLNGEWFKPEAELIDWIKSNQ